MGIGPGQLSFETLRERDREARHMLGRQAFGSTQPFDPDNVMPDDQFVAVYDGDELVASSALIEGGHWFGGKPVHGPGISGVSVAPHRRGTGVAKPMLEHVVHRLDEDGAAISGLLPTTASYYRGAGWELAGEWVTRQLPLEAFRTTVRADADIEPFELGQLRDFASSYDALAARGAGHVVRGDRWWWFRERNIASSDRDAQGYLLRARVGNDEGYITLRSAKSKRGIFDLWITDLGADSAEVLQALGGQVARFGTVADLVKSNQPLWALEALTTEGQRWQATESFGWMLRIVDVAKAFQQRGWPPISGEVVLAIDDPVLDANSATVRIDFDRGRPTVTLSDDEGSRISIQALASWFTGWRTASQLAFLGLFEADAETVALMDGLGAGPSPITPEFY